VAAEGFSPTPPQANSLHCRAKSQRITRVISVHKRKFFFENKVDKDVFLTDNISDVGLGFPQRK